MSTRKKRLLIVCMLSVVCMADAAPAKGEWVVGGYFGDARTASAALSIHQQGLDTDVTLASVAYRSESFNSPVYYGYRVAYFLPRSHWLGIETEFLHSKVYADTSAVTHVSGRYRGAAVDRDMNIGDILERFSISHGFNFLLVNVVTRRTVRRDEEHAVALMGRAGLGPTIPHPESRIAGMSHEGYEIGAIGLQLAAGIEVRLWRGVAAMAEYKITHANQQVSVAEGQADGRFTSQHGVVGLTWHSGDARLP